MAVGLLRHAGRRPRRLHAEIRLDAFACLSFALPPISVRPLPSVKRRPRNGNLPSPSPEHRSRAFLGTRRELAEAREIETRERPRNRRRGIAFHPAFSRPVVLPLR